ncbi:putative transcription factor WRKY family [Medicago truncatula]|uniref:Putative transcription factor WRKY family n=1 Tax=Medicago truncatula TaxID=3880 RepID=G7JNY7_MEDTR|nr:WRKY transcription factor 23 [Medicago truncatula]AES91994.2 WRKY family transcription factor [Medicago truncatula]RHN64382.1 putative transcription factor WRKY family [Medicago truncatula]
MKKNMANSSTTAFSGEIPNKKNKGSCVINFPFSPALPSCSIFDMIPPSQSDDQQSSSFAGYIDLLSTNDFTSSSATLFDWFPTIDTDMSAPPSTTQLPPLPAPSPAASEVLNNPATPVSVSSSISSSSNAAGVADKVMVEENEHEHEEELEGDEAEEKDEDHGIRLVENQNDQDQMKKQLKPKKKNKNKKLRPARVTFKTKSDVDHLDDGYRWRKYGQKPVKNSPFPRSYYRCTAGNCEVKKRIERSAADSSIVLTSYEGHHIHLSPVLLRAANLGIMSDPSGFQEQVHQHHNTTSGVVGSSVLGNEFAMSQSQQYQKFQDQNQNVLHHQRQAVPSLLYNSDYNNSFNISPLSNIVNSADNLMISSTSFGGFLQNQENYGGGNSSLSSSMMTSTNDMVRNNGLLQDMIAPMEMGGAGAKE